MIANMNEKGRQTRLLAAIVVMAMIMCAVAVVATPVQADDTALPEYSYIDESETVPTPVMMYENEEAQAAGTGMELTLKQALDYLYTEDTEDTFDGYIFVFSEGEYNVTGISETLGDNPSQYVSKFNIKADNVQIIGAGAGSTIFYTDFTNGNYQTPQNDANQGSTIAVIGNGVSLSGFSVTPMITCDGSNYTYNKTIEIYGNNTTISGIALIKNTYGTDTVEDAPGYTSTGSGVILFNTNTADENIVTISDVTVDNGSINLGYLSSTTTTIDISNITFNNTSAYGISFGGAGSTEDLSRLNYVDAENVTVNVESGDVDLSSVINNAVPGFTINLNASDSVDSDATIKDGVTVNVADGVTLTVPQNTDLNVAGALGGAGSVSGTVTVDVDTGSVSEDLGATVTNGSYDALSGVTDSASGEGWTYDDGTLTLDGYNGEKYFKTGGLRNIVIENDSTITISVAALNQYFTDNPTANVFGAIRNNTGDNLTISGSGTLTIIIDITDLDFTKTAVNSQKIVAIWSGAALDISSDIVIDVNGVLGDVQTGYTEGVYGLYSLGDLSVSDCNLDITVAENESLAFAVSGPSTSETITFTNVTGTIVGGNRAVQTGGSTLTFSGCDLLLSGNEKAIQANNAGGSVVITGNSHITLELLDNTTSGDYNGGDNDRYGIKVNDLTVDSGSTLVTDGMRLFTIGETAATLDNKGVIIVNGGYTQNPDGFEPAVAGLMSDATGFMGNVMNGVPSNASEQYIYLANGAATYNVVVIGTVTDAVQGDFALSVEQANSMMGSSKEITIIAVGGTADITGLQIGDGVVVTVGGNVSGTIDGVTFDGLTNATYTMVNGVLTIKMAGTTAIGGAVSLAGDATLGVAEGAQFKGTFNGITLDFTAGSGFFFGADPVQNTETPGDGETGTDTPAEDPSAGTQTVAVLGARAVLAAPADEPAVQADAPGTPVISGGMDLASGIAGDALILDGADITTSSETEITITVDNLTIRGDVVIGSNVTIVVGEGATITIEEGATLSGEGTLRITGNGTVVNNSTADAISLNIESQGNTITVYDEEGFINALPYYSTITVDGKLDFTADVLQKLGISSVSVENKTIILADGSSFTINKDVTMDFVNSTVSIAENGNATMTVLGTIGIDDSNIFVSVDASKGTVDAVNNVMNVDGNAIQIGTVGFGRILNINGDFTVGNTTGGNLTVYGEVRVNDGVTLTLNQGSTITILSGGVLSVIGTANINGNVTVDGTMNVTGTVAVGANGVIGGDGKVSVESTMDVSGTLNAPTTVSGTLTINGNATTTITMMDGATLNAEKITGTVTVKSGTSYEPPAANAENQPTVVIKENSLELYNVSGLVIAATEAMTSETKDNVTTNTYTSTFDLSGVIAAGTITIEDVTTTGDVVISDMSLASGVTLINNEAVTVSGTLAAADGSTITNNGVMTVTGTVTVTDVADTVTGSASAVIGGDGTVNATYYEQTTAATATVGETVVRTYTTFDNAVDAMAGADDTTITVSGEQTSAVDKSVTGTVVVLSGAKFTVDDGVTLTFTAQGYMVNQNTTAKQVVVEGTLTFDAYANYTEGTVANTVVEDDPKIEADVCIVSGDARTFTSLANAIEMAGGETATIILNQDVTIKDDLTIPSNITVSSDRYGITVGETTSTKNVTLTVEGSVQLTGATNTITLPQGAQIEGSNPADYYNGVLSVSGNGYVYISEGSLADIADATGAHYQKQVDLDNNTSTPAVTLNVIATVQYAAADSANVYGADRQVSIVIYGDNTVNSAVFTAPSEKTLNVTVQAEASITGDIILGAGVTIAASAGDIDGTVGVADGAVVDIDGSAIVKALTYTDENDNSTVRLYIEGDISGNVIVSEGSVYADGVSVVADKDANGKDVKSTLTVANGATLVVIAGESVTATGDYAAVVIDGTLDIQASTSAAGSVDADALIVNGTVTVAGTLTVGDASVNGTVNVTGTLNISDDGIVIVGTKPTQLGSAATGIVNVSGDNAALSIGERAYIKAYAGTEVTVPTGIPSTSFTINDQLYMTVYASIGVSIADALIDETYTLEGLYTGLYYGSIDNPSNDGLYDPSNWYTSSDRVANTALTSDSVVNDIGDEGYTALYAHVDPTPVSGTVSEGTGLRMYIDNVPAETMIGQNGAISLPIGQHTVSFDVLAQYDGTNAVITLTVNGNTTTYQSGDTITITQDMNGFVLACSGAVPSSGSGDITVNVPSQDDGMSLTDILLIVLVILIVIMAIIVALRLMRS